MQRGGVYEEMDEMDVVKQYYSSDREIQESIKNELKPDMERSRDNLDKYMKKLGTLQGSENLFRNFMVEVWPPPGTGPPKAPPLPREVD